VSHHELNKFDTAAGSKLQKNKYPSLIGEKNESENSSDYEGNHQPLSFDQQYENMVKK